MFRCELEFQSAQIFFELLPYRCCNNQIKIEKKRKEKLSYWIETPFVLKLIQQLIPCLSVKVAKYYAYSNMQTTCATAHIALYLTVKRSSSCFHLCS